MTIPEGQTTGDAPKNPADAPLAKTVTPPLAAIVPEIVGEINDGEENVPDEYVPPLTELTLVITPDKVEAKIVELSTFELIILRASPVTLVIAVPSIVPLLITGTLIAAPLIVEATKVPPETVPCSVSPEAVDERKVSPDAVNVQAAS